MVPVVGGKNLLPPDKRGLLDALEAKQDEDSLKYEKIMMEDLYLLMICRTHPWPISGVRAFAHADQTIYVQMQGKREFLVNRQPQGLGAVELPARDTHQNPHHRCALRPDGPRGHE